MCGIAGIFSYRGSACVDDAELAAIRDHMAARGPDGSGSWFSADHRVGLANRRLAIIDLSEAGAQPMSTEDGALTITYNGEIYNYRELRAGLEARGHRFRSSSDTEVLLHLYREHGPEMVEMLRGMFAFAIWDQTLGWLFLARDPLGIKPLYYADDGRTLRFASQVKALLAGRAVDTARDPAGLAGFYLWGSVPEPFTLYSHVRSLPAGTTLRIEHDRPVTLARYFDVGTELAKAGDSPPEVTQEEMRERLRAALLDSVRHHMESDVPVGVLLSAGLDSTSVMALAQRVTSYRMASITLGFREFEGNQVNEVSMAAMVADRYGTSHMTCWLTRDDFDQELDHLKAAMDQPSIDGVNTFFVSRAAAQAGLKVALSGLGGDELFGGYPSFTEIPRLLDKTAAFPFASVGRAFRVVTAPWLERFTSPKYAGILEYGKDYPGAYLLRRGLFMPWELPKLMGREMAREGWRELMTLARLARSVHGIKSPHARVSALEMQWYMRNQLLRDTDWAGMAWSLEIRTPLVDRELFCAVAPLLASKHPPGKSDMVMARVAPVSEAFLAREKKGFSIPMQRWLEETRGVPPGRGLRGWARMLASS